jgi:hypothetical protein
MSAWSSYLFWPNPGNTGYDNPKVIALIVVCLLLVIGSFVLSRWRGRLTNASLKKVSKSWPMACVWFGLLGLLFTVSRVEQIQFLAMRFLWVLWAAAAVLYVLLQIRMVRTRTYEVIPTEKSRDPRSRYLPKRKRR